MDITWECFAYVNAANKETAFENMCRLLYKQQFVTDTQVVHSNPNNPGIENDPITRISDGKRISFQAKFFANGIVYPQMERYRYKLCLENQCVSLVLSAFVGLRM